MKKKFEKKLKKNENLKKKFEKKFEKNWKFEKKEMQYVKKYNEKITRENDPKWNSEIISLISNDFFSEIKKKNL